MSAGSGNVPDVGMSHRESMASHRVLDECAAGEDGQCEATRPAVSKEARHQAGEGAASEHAGYDSPEAVVGLSISDAGLGLNGNPGAAATTSESDLHSGLAAQEEAEDAQNPRSPSGHARCGSTESSTSSRATCRSEDGSQRQALIRGESAGAANTEGAGTRGGEGAGGDGPCISGEHGAEICNTYVQLSGSAGAHVHDGDVQSAASASPTRDSSGDQGCAAASESGGGGGGRRGAVEKTSADRIDAPIYAPIWVRFEDDGNVGDRAREAAEGKLHPKLNPKLNSRPWAPAWKGPRALSPAGCGGAASSPRMLAAACSGSAALNAKAAKAPGSNCGDEVDDLNNANDVAASSDVATSSDVERHCHYSHNAEHELGASGAITRAQGRSGDKGGRHSLRKAPPLADGMEASRGIGQGDGSGKWLPSPWAGLPAPKRMDQDDKDEVWATKDRVGDDVDPSSTHLRLTTLSYMSFAACLVLTAESVRECCLGCLNLLI